MIAAQSKTHVRIYNLQAQSIVKKLSTNVKWISSIAVHPQGSLGNVQLGGPTQPFSGDNIILGSYDRKLCWFDLDLGSTPYKTLRCALCPPEACLNRVLQLPPAGVAAGGVPQQVPALRLVQRRRDRARLPRHGVQVCSAPVPLARPRAAAT